MTDRIDAFIGIVPGLTSEEMSQLWEIAETWAKRGRTVVLFFQKGLHILPPEWPRIGLSETSTLVGLWRVEPPGKEIWVTFNRELGLVDMEYRNVRPKLLPE